jgi:hypothetical protein
MRGDARPSLEGSAPEERRRQGVVFRERHYGFLFNLGRMKAKGGRRTIGNSILGH